MPNYNEVQLVTGTAWGLMSHRISGGTHVDSGADLPAAGRAASSAGGPAAVAGTRISQCPDETAAEAPVPWNRLEFRDGNG